MAITDSVIKRLEMWILPRLAQTPVVSIYAGTRGWPFVIAWIHRFFGILLVIYVLFHIYTLSFLETPALFDHKMKFFRFFLFVLLEWLLAIPVIFHALNGSRLVLYESFGFRKDGLMIRRLLGISVAYVFSGFVDAFGQSNRNAALFLADCQHNRCNPRISRYR